MRYLLCLLIAFGFSSPALRGQNQIPEAKKIMGLYNEESSWSPDGKTIAFDSSRPGKTSIFTWNVETREQKRLTEVNANDITPEWSPDGQRIIYCSARDNTDQSHAPEGEIYEIYTIKADGTDLKQVTHDKGINTYPSFSRDGRHIVFRKIIAPKNSEVFVMNADGSSPRNLTNNLAFDGWPRWSPDDSRIVFASNRAGPDYEIYV